ncbi:MAG: ParA family protein [Thermodesulfobacteriota bacterium]
MGKIISVANQKGGVGKTTTAVNLSASLAVAEKKVLLIDLDPQGNATSGMGITEKRIGRTIYNVLIEEVEIEEVIISSPLPFLHLIPSNSDLIGAEIEFVDDPRRENRLKNALDYIEDRYDYIIIDCPPSLGILTLNALTASDAVLIPLQCEYYALEGLSQLLKTIKIIKKRFNPSLYVEGILLTMFDSRNNLSHQVAEEVISHFKGKVFETIIPRNVRLSESPGFGKPVIQYDIHSKGAISYLQLAKEFLFKGEKTYAKEEGPGKGTGSPTP